jgi:hypothetical protein
MNKRLNERLNELRLDAGISQIADDSGLVVINREGNIIDPLIGLEKFADLIIEDIGEMLRGLLVEESFDRDIGPWEYWNKALGHLALEIEERFGVSK